MKKTLSISVTALLLLSLVGCAGEATPQPTVTVTETVTAEPSPEPSKTEEESLPESDRKFDSHGTSERGNLIKHVGDWAGIGSTETEDLTVNFMIKELELGAKCTSEFKQKPKYGQFVAVHVEIETFPHLEEYGPFSMSAYDFAAFKKDGTRVNDVVGNSSMCLDQSESIPADIGPGEKVRGRIILDLPKDATVITFGTYLAGGNWEWPLADTKDA